jgi:hypothetical protein
MGTTVVSDPILARFRAALDAIYGSRIECVVLFGSCARKAGFRLRYHGVSPRSRQLLA